MLRYIVLLVNAGYDNVRPIGKRCPGRFMQNHNSSRREFLQKSSALTAASMAKIIMPGIAALSQAACSAKKRQADFSVLGVDEALEFEAIAARILPTTATPGAREAGVVYFFDQAFGTVSADSLGFARGGLAQLQAGIEDGRQFSELSENEQDAYLLTQDRTPFFGLLRFMTLCGFFSMGKYGGNKDDIGWKLVNMDPHVHSYTSPFGYYDAEYLKEHPNG